MPFNCIAFLRQTWSAWKSHQKPSLWPHNKNQCLMSTKQYLDKPEANTVCCGLIKKMEFFGYNPWMYVWRKILASGSKNILWTVQHGAWSVMLQGQSQWQRNQWMDSSEYNTKIYLCPSRRWREFGFYTRTMIQMIPQPQNPSWIYFKKHNGGVTKYWFIGCLNFHTQLLCLSQGSQLGIYSMWYEQNTHSKTINQTLCEGCSNYYAAYGTMRGHYKHCIDILMYFKGEISPENKINVFFTTLSVF